MGCTVFVEEDNEERGGGPMLPHVPKFQVMFQYNFFEYLMITGLYLQDIINL